MTNDMLWMILAVTISLGAGQSIEGSNATSGTIGVIETGCHIDGIWYDPCPLPPGENCWCNGVWYNPCPNDPNDSATE
jgi:hypothetical protein